MNTIIPIDYYVDFYMNICLALTLLTLLHTYILKINESKNLNYINFIGLFIMIFLTLYIGQRPPSHKFGDTINYYRAFIKYSNGESISEKVNDYGWHVFMKTMSNFTSIHTFFTICAFVYIYPLYKISKEFFKVYWFYAFFMFVVSYSFWTYGVNGVRNGAACSLFLWGVSNHKNKIVMIVLFFLSTLFHKTTLLPILAFIITYFYNNPKVYFKAWLACIPLSLILGSAFIIVFSSLGFGGDDSRLSGYLNSQSDEGTFASTGFRWDFLFHSAFAVVAGWYFVIKRKFKDKLYFQLLNTYLICNGFWILVINANYSNRFAYLSWFMMAIIIIYPLLKQQFFKNNHIMIGNIMLVYFAFTYFMYFVYY